MTILEGLAGILLAFHGHSEGLRIEVSSSPDHVKNFDYTSTELISESWPGGWSPDQWRNGAPNNGGRSVPSKTVRYGTTACSFSGRTGQLSITNDTSFLVFLELYHPDSGAKYWAQELSAGGTVVTPFAIGNDWGLTFKYAGYSARQIRCVGNVTSLSEGFWKGWIGKLTQYIPKN